MSKKVIQTVLENALLNNAAFSLPLYQAVLTDFEDDMTASLKSDADDVLICLVAEDGEVALMLADKDGSLLQNEAARQRLQQMWQHNYASNVHKFLPIFVESLHQGMLAVAGIKWVY